MRKIPVLLPVAVQTSCFRGAESWVRYPLAGDFGLYWRGCEKNSKPAYCDDDVGCEVIVAGEVFAARFVRLYVPIKSME